MACLYVEDVDRLGRYRRLPENHLFAIRRPIWIRIYRVLGDQLVWLASAGSDRINRPGPTRPQLHKHDALAFRRPSRQRGPHRWNGQLQALAPIDTATPES